MAGARFSRAIVKVSGEALGGGGGFGIDPGMLGYVARELAKAQALGVELGVVLGGGNIFRGVSQAASGMDRVGADYMGMLATVINSLALADALRREGVGAVVMSAIPMPQVAEGYVRTKALEHLRQGKVVVLAAGTGNPFFTTDTAAALRALELGAEVLVKATKVDGIYTSDPETDPDATLIKRTTYREVLARGLKVMDAAAISLAEEGALKVVVVNLSQEDSIRGVLAGEDLGSWVEASDDR